jgi:AraC family transcriptional regulator, alkane utilization regulator
VAKALIWTVDDLAREIAVSRSVLAQRFTELAGGVPMRYLAKQMMREGTSHVQEVATRVGDDSEAATGSPPATWRRGTHGAT